MKKKLFVFIPAFETGGVEKNAVFFANSLLSEGYEVSVIYCRKVDGQFSKLDDGVKKIKVRRLPNLPLVHERIIDAVSMLIFGYLKLRIKSKHSVLVGFQSNVVAIILAKLLKVRSIVRLSNHYKSISYENSFIRKGSEYLKKKVYKYADIIIANSQELAADYSILLDQTVQTVYNPIDLIAIGKQKYKVPDEAVYQDKKLPILLSVGRLAKQKNFEFLINSFHKAQEKLNMRLVIVGEGDQRGGLEKLIRALSLEGKVFLIGHRNNTCDYYKHSDLFVLSSYYEGMPNALIEAIAYKCPSVSTNIKTGPKEILLNGKGGDLVELGNVRELSEKIVENIKNRLEAKNKNLAAYNNLDIFSSIRTINSYVKMIDSL